MSRRPEPPRPADGTDRIELRRDGAASTIVVDGHPQSHVNLDDPADLEFEYLLQMALVLDALSPAPPTRLAVTHVGGAGLSLARYVAGSRPGSPQVVFEPDQELTALVRRELPLPRGHRIRVRPTEGRTGVAALAHGSADVVVIDAYAGGRVPAALTTAEAFVQVAQVLRSGGVLLVNLADEPGLRYVARVAAGAASLFDRLALVGTHEVLKGRRFGNVVLVASRTPLDESAIRTALARQALGAGYRDAARMARWVRSARPFTDADAERSPVPPDAGRWRAR